MLSRLITKRLFSNLYHRYNPYTKQPVYEGTYMEDKEIDVIVEKSTQAQKEWSKRAVNDRVQIVHEFLNKLEERALNLSVMITEAMGKPITQSSKEIETSIFVSRRHLNHVPSFKELVNPGQRWFNSEPVGVVLQVAPWNWPVLYTLIKLVPALVSGNSVILRHSYMTPQVGRAIESIFVDIGHPDLVKSVEVENDRKLVTHPGIGFLSFIGEYGTGMKVYEDACFYTLNDVSLRFAGKDAAYVRADADLQQAVRVIAESSFENGGQTDLAVKRVYVNAMRAEEFETLLTDFVTSTYQPGNPMFSGTTLGPLAEPENMFTLIKQTEDAVVQGARVLCGGMEAYQNDAPEAHFFAPTILTNVENDMEIMQELSNGPLLTISTVENDDEAIKLINDSKFGNAVSIFTRDRNALHQIIPRLDVGQVYGNHCNYYECVELPHDPRKESGRGIFLSRDAYKIFTKPKSHNRLP